MCAADNHVSRGIQNHSKVNKKYGFGRLFPLFTFQVNWIEIGHGRYLKSGIDSSNRI